MTYLFILIGYAILMIAVGVILSRRVRESGDFFVAGRELNAGLIFSTLLAANIGAGSTVGATGLGYRDGLSAWWWVGAAGIGSLILAFTVGPKIWRIARENNLYTVGDYLEFRYNRTMRGLVAILLWFGSLAILAGQLIAMEQIFKVTAGLGKIAGCLLAAAVITVYFSAGGLHATARVNVIQLVVKLLGFALALIFLLTAIGGWGAIRDTVMASEGAPDAQRYFNLMGDGMSGALSYIALLTPSFIVSPGLLQKLFGARDESAVRRGVGLNALGLLAFAIVPVLMGIIARSQFPGLENREQALPTLLTESLPLWLGGLLLGGLFSAELSAADAVLFMLTTSLSKDLYKTFLRPDADDKSLLRVARLTAVGCGAIGAGLAIWFGSVISALRIFYTLLSAALLLPLLFGLYTRRVSSRAAITAMLVSVTVTFALERLTNGRGYSGLPSLIWGTLAGLVVMSFWVFERRFTHVEKV
ncbi:MAG TPA: sodium:solute symporter family protein [Blastocatellia bacterium]|nr:sodium:solute symporter family protein [Blastocatellia bacterium]